tara:strand:- start:4434 stop:5552 length:1119 start_codon:yes stop_codon:yes gene_type:complete
MAAHIPPPPSEAKRQPTYGQAVTLARDAFGREIAGTSGPASQPAPSPFGPQTSSDQPKEKREQATDALGRRAGALLDALDFPTFVASLVHGTYDAIVDSSIRQMESFADLVSAVAKPVDQFTQENVTLGQARGWLVEQYPRDITLMESGNDFSLAPLRGPDDDSPPPSWLADFGFADEDLNAELLEQEILPLARTRVAEQRLSTLATMVLMGMQRVTIKDGTIGAKLRFQATAADNAAVRYATTNDPNSGGTVWGARGNETAQLTVSTVDVNVQSDSELKAQLSGSVDINFASETIPLDQFVDSAQRALLERHGQRKVSTPAVPAAPPPVPAPAALPPVAQPAPAVAPAPVQQPQPAAQPAPQPDSTGGATG